MCLITAELPIDPVTAEDGRCYERCAIEEWFERQPQPQVKSPVTNEPMGKRLLPAVQVRNSLKRLVESGAISGSKADAWKKAMAEEAEVAEDALPKARRGTGKGTPQSCRRCGQPKRGHLCTNPKQTAEEGGAEEQAWQGAARFRKPCTWRELAP